MENPSEMMTIKAFAEASGRSQQTIYKQIETRLAPYLHIIEGKKYIERRALLEVFGEGGVKPIQPPKREQNEGLQLELRAEIAFLRGQLEAKDKQLEAKDRQIEAKDKQLEERGTEVLNLTAALKDAQSSLKAAQALHAGTMQQQLDAGEPESQDETAIDVETVEPEPPQAVLEQKASFAERFRLALKILKGE